MKSRIPIFWWSVFLMVALLPDFNAGAQIMCHYLRSFGFPNLMGQHPLAPLIEGADGVLYGTARGGDKMENSVIFGVNKDGSGYRVLHQFGSVTNDGLVAESELVEASDGFLYGTTSSGGQSGYGVVFRLSKDGNEYRILRSFAEYGEGNRPRSGLLEGSDGLLYGTTSSGFSLFAGGTLFRMNKDGSGYQILHQFGYLGSDGSWPYGGLLECSDGWVYGTTTRGGEKDAGALFKLAKDGTDFQVVYNFGQGTGSAITPYGTLLEGSDGLIYGASRLGGTTNSGAIYRVSKDGSNYATLHHFGVYSSGGSYPSCKLVEGADAALYGTAPNGNGTVFKLNKDGSSFRILHTFFSSTGEGFSPVAGLLSTADGWLYGTTTSGGSNSLGTIYRLQEDGSAFEVLRQFVWAGGDGLIPTLGLVEGDSGLIYGAIREGGVGAFDGGSGVIFRVRKDGTDYRVLHSFDFNSKAGSQPQGGLLNGGNGLLFGTTVYGGIFDGGTIFAIDQEGNGFKIIYSFPRASSGGGGCQPLGTLARGLDGDLYGVTTSGGSNFMGSIFRVRKDGTSYQEIHHFRADGKGRFPVTGLLAGADGVLYGTTAQGSESDDYCSVFKINPDGTGYSVLHSFRYDGVDGIRARCPLLQTADGTIYGTTFQGGKWNAGTIYKMNTNGGDYVILHNFGDVPHDGNTPLSALVEGIDGALYGTTVYGGLSASLDGEGTIYKINKDGTGYCVIWSFGIGSGIGFGPVGDLLLAKDGDFFGTTRSGGESRIGTLFRVSGVQPRLDLNLNGDATMATLSWSSRTVGFVLQSTADINNPEWHDYDGPVIDQGNTRLALIPNTGGRLFWRLKR